MDEWIDLPEDDQDEWLDVPDESEKEESWGEFLANSGLAAYQGLENTARDAEKALLGGIDWAVDSVPFVDLDTPLDDVYWKRRKEQDAATKELVEPGYETFSNVVRGAAPTLLSYLATRSPQAAAAVPAGFGSVDEYQEGRRRGDGWGEASAKAAEKFGVDYALNRFEISPAISSRYNPAIRTGLTALTGGVGNALSEANNVALDYLSNEDTSEGLSRITQAGKLGLATGGLFGGGVELLRGIGANMTPVDGTEQSKVDFYAQKASQNPEVNFAEPTVDRIQPGVEQTPNLDGTLPVDSGFMITTPEGPMDLASYLEQQGVKNNLVEPGVPQFLERKPELPNTVDNAALLEARSPQPDLPIIESSGLAEGGDFGGGARGADPFGFQEMFAPQEPTAPSGPVQRFNPRSGQPDQRLAAEVQRYQDAKLARDLELQEQVLGNRTESPQGIIPESDIPILEGAPVVDPTLLNLPKPKRSPLIERVEPSSARVTEAPITDEQVLQRLADLGLVDAPQQIVEPDPVIAPFNNRGNVRKTLDPRVQEIAETVRREQDERIAESTAQEIQGVEAERIIRGEEILNKRPATFEKVEAANDFAEPANKIISPDEPMPPSVVMRRKDTGTDIIVLDNPDYKSRDAAYQAEMLELRQVIEMVRPEIPFGSQPSGHRGKVQRNPQRGALRIPFGETIETFLDRPKDASPGYNEYQGSNPVQAVKAGFRKLMEMPLRFAEKYPQAKVLYDQIVLERPAHYNVAISKFRDSLAAYTNQSEAVRSEANHVLAGWRKAAADAKKNGQPVNLISPQSLAKAGITSEVAEAVLAANRTMDMALTHFHDAMTKLVMNADTQPGTKAQNIKKLDDYVASLRDSNYVPFGRFGKWAVSGKDANGQKYVSFHESKFEAAKAKKALNAKGGKFEFSRIEEVPDSMYEDMPRDVVGFMSILNGETDGKLPAKGIAANFIEAQLVDGYDTNFTRSMARYLHGIANLHSRANTDVHIKQALKQVKDTAPQIYDRLSKYDKFMNKPGNKWAAGYQKLNSFMFLAGSRANALLNGLEPLLTTYPQIGHYLKGVAAPEKVMAIAAGKYALLPGKWIAPQGWAKLDPELAFAVEFSKQRGFLDDSSMSEFVSMGEGNAPTPNWVKSVQQKTPRSVAQVAEVASQLPTNPVSSLLKVPGMLQSTIENNVKIFDYIVGHEIAKRNGLKGEEAAKFAEFFVTDVKSSGNRGTQNVLMGRIPVLSPLISTFKNYVANQLRLLGRSSRDAMKGNPGPLVRSMFMMWGAAGVAGIPGAKQAISFLTESDEDPKQTIRRWFPGALGDLVLYGLTSALTDTVISDSLNLANSFPDTKRSVKEAIGTAVVGPIGGYVAEKIPFALELFQKNRPDLAIEQLAPRFARDIMRSYRYDREGYTDAQGNVIIPREELTDSDISKVASGFKSLKFAKKGEENELTKSLEDTETEKSGKAYDKIFEALTGAGSKSLEELFESEPELLDALDSDGFERAMTYRMEARKNKPMQRIKKLSPHSLEKYLEGAGRIYGGAEEY